MILSLNKQFEEKMQISACLSYLWSELVKTDRTDSK